MKIKVSTPQELGLIMRAVRKTQSIRIEDVASSANVGPVFLREAERGKETVTLVRVLRVLRELGIELHVDVPESILPTLDKLRQQGLKPLPRRSPPVSK